MLPETSVCPSGEKATEVMVPRCAPSVHRQAPSRARQSLMIPSYPAEASVSPSGEKARVNMPLWG